MSDPREFLQRVLAWPKDEDAPGFVNLHWTQPSTRDPKKMFWVGKPFRKINDFMSMAHWAQGLPTTRDMYMCMSTQSKVRFNKNGNAQAERLQANAVALKAIWIDLDVKPPPKGYKDVTAAVTALDEFLTAAKLPAPSALIGSGGGVHVYWISDRALTPQEWQPYANGLKALILKHGLLCDAGCTTDSARVLRVPGTKNFKTDPPRPVLTLTDRGPDYDFAKSLAFLRDVAPVAVVGAGSTLSDLVDPTVLTSHRPAAFSGLPERESLADGVRDPLPPINPHKAFVECKFLQDALTTGGKEYTQPMWNLTTLAAVFMENGHELAHAMGSQHPGYTHASTEELWARKVREHETKGLGYPSCSAIQSAGCTACAGCLHLGKIKSPLNLTVDPLSSSGSVTPQPQAPASSTFVPSATWPPTPDLADLALPDGYVLDGYNHICKVIEDEDKDGQPVTYLYPLFGCVIFGQPWVEKNTTGDVLHFECSTDVGHTTPVSLPVSIMGQPMKLPSALLERRCAYIPANKKYLEDFVVAWKTKLEHMKESIAAQPYGWWYPDEGATVPRGFVYGGTIYKDDGTELPAGYGDPNLTQFYKPVGSIQPWFTAAKSVTDQKEPILDAILASSFAAPLIEMSGERGMILEVEGPSGTGKTSIGRIAYAVWGHPIHGRDHHDATFKSTMEKAGVLRNLPLGWDEITDKKIAEKMLNITHQLSQGTGSNRLNSEIRFRPRADWQTLLVVTSNISFYDELTRLQTTHNAGKYRVFEMHFERPQREKDTMEYAVMVQALNHNYGKMGQVFSKWLSRNYAPAMQLVHAYADEIRHIVHQRQDERNWVALCAALLAGATIANILGTEIDVDRLKMYLIKNYLDLRERIGNDATEGTGPDAAETAVAQFLNMHHNESIWTDTFIAHRGQPKLVNVIHSPLPSKQGPLFIQYCQQDRLIRINKKIFNDYLRDENMSESTIKKALEKHFGATEVKQTLGAGTGQGKGSVPLLHIPVPTNHAWENALFSFGGQPPQQNAGDTSA